MADLNIFIILSFLFIYTTAHEDGTHTIQYTESNFDEEIPKKSHFVMFYAPWCGHCQRLSPTWNQLSELLNDEDSEIKVAKVDCTTDNRICDQQDVTGYPTLKFFKKGDSEGVKFRGTRDLPSLTNFINEQMLREVEENVVDGEKIMDEVVKGVTSKLVELNEENFEEVLSTGRNFVKFYAPWCGHCQILAPIWEELAKTLESEQTVGIAKIDCTQYKTQCAKYEVSSYPTLLWIENGKKIDKYQGARTHEDLKEFVRVMMGAEESSYAAQELNQEHGQIRSPVGVLTGSNFHDNINHGVTIVKFFAPWCGHCKRLAPTWEELGKQLQTMQGVHVMQVDCTLHNNRKLCSDQEVEGFPTIYIYKDGQKVDEYNGSRNLNDLYKFVMKHVPPQPKRDEL